MRLWNYLKEKMLLTPNQTICEKNAVLTYEEAVVWSEIFAPKLKNINCCAVLCQSEMAASMALLACFAAGVTAVPLSQRYGEAHCKKILDFISPDAIITDRNEKIEVLKVENSNYEKPHKHPALIMCTSGTTGVPKGVMLSERNIMTNVSDITSYFVLDKMDTLLIVRPLYHCAVLTGEFLTALVSGANIRFYSGQFNPAKNLELIHDYQITAFCGTPTLLSAMAKLQKNESAKTLRFICISGECMGSDTGISIMNAFPNAKIFHIYGLTEACPRVSYLPWEQFANHPDCVGVPLPSVSLKILDENGRTCPNNTPGTLWVKGKNVMLGYYKAPNETKTVLKKGWLCTGDAALISIEGFLKIKGRNDDLIIKAGMNIYPAEIESTLKCDPRVKEVLAFSYENRFGTQIGLKIAGDFPSVLEIRKLCNNLLPSYQRPTKIELVKELLKNGSGKIIRRILQ